MWSVVVAVGRGLSPEESAGSTFVHAMLRLSFYCLVRRVVGLSAWRWHCTYPWQKAQGYKVEFDEFRGCSSPPQTVGHSESGYTLSL